MRRCQHDGVDRGVGQRLIEAAEDTQPMPGGKLTDPSRLAADRRGEAQPVAFVLHRRDQGLAPPAQADDCRIDHGVWRSSEFTGGAPAYIAVIPGRCEAPSPEPINTARGGNARSSVHSTTRLSLWVPDSGCAGPGMTATGETSDPD